MKIVTSLGKNHLNYRILEHKKIYVAYIKIISIAVQIFNNSLNIKKIIK